MTVQIKRRVNKDGKYMETTEDAELIETGKYGCLVKLKSGDIIKRKKKDVTL